MYSARGCTTTATAAATARWRWQCVAAAATTTTIASAATAAVVAVAGRYRAPVHRSLATATTGARTPLQAGDGLSASSTAAAAAAAASAAASASSSCAGASVRFWQSANRFLVSNQIGTAALDADARRPQRPQQLKTQTLKEDASAGRLEARWTAECLAAVQAHTADHVAPRDFPVSLHADRVGSRDTVPDISATVVLHRPSDAHLVQLAELYQQATDLSPHEFTFERYAATTQALVRLAVENPKRPRSRHQHKRETHPIRTDPLFALRLLHEYWTTISRTDTPLAKATPPIAPSQLAWWKMMASMQAVLGLIARPSVDVVDDRSQLLQMILDRMRAHALPSVDGVTNLYEYAIRHDTFFRALLFSALQCHDMVFASSLLPLIPQICLPVVSDAGVEWTPIARMNQMNLFHLFMAKCCTEILREFQAHEAASAAPSSTTALDLSLISRSTLVSLYPGFVDLYAIALNAQSSSPLKFDARLSVRFNTPLFQNGATAPAPAAPKTFSARHKSALADQIEQRTSMLDTLMHAFGAMTNSGFTPMMHSYNFVLFGLTHTHTQPTEGGTNALTQGLPTEATMRSLLSECMTTISTERLAFYNMTSYTILLAHTLRAHGQAHRANNELGLMTWTVRAFKDTLKQWRKREWKPRADDEGDQIMLTKVVATLLVRATEAMQRTTDVNKIAKGILLLHESIAPLLPDADQMHILTSSPSTAAAVGAAHARLSSRSPQAIWHKFVFVSLARHAALPAIEEFLDSNFQALADSDLVEALEACPEASRLAMFEVIEQWMSQLAVSEPAGFKPDQAILTGLAQATDLRNVTQPLTSTALDSTTSTLASAAPLAVSDIFLKWQLAKSRLHSRTRYQLGLGPPPPSLESKQLTLRDEDIASTREAARYVIYHARKLHLEHSEEVDTPLSQLSMYAAPEFKLPPSIVAAPNFVTGWVVICAGWFTHLGEKEAFTRIAETLAIVAKAAKGQEWDDTKTSPPVEPQETPSALRSATSSIARWARQQRDRLLTNPLESIHIFTPLPPTTPLLETQIAFHRLHPELLNSIVYAYGTLPHLVDSKSPHWLRVLPRLDQFHDLFDLSKAHPVMLKYFTLQCDSEAQFLRLFRELPVASLPAHCAALARQWDLTRSTNEWIRGRRLLLYLMRMTLTPEERHATPPPQWIKRQPPKQVLSQDGLKQCVGPLLKKISGKGLAHELRWWMAELSRDDPKFFANFWDLINHCVRRNETAVTKLLQSKPPLTKAELEQRGYALLADAQSWRQALLQPNADATAPTPVTASTSTITTPLAATPPIAHKPRGKLHHHKAHGKKESAR